MPDSINFVRERHRRLTKNDLTDQRIFRGTGIAFAALLVVFLGVMGVQFFFRFQLDQTVKRQDNLKLSVLSQSQIEKSYVLFANKLKALGDIFTNRTNKQQAIQFFTSLFGPQVLIQEITYEADEALLSFSLNAPNVFILQEVFTKLDAPEVRAQFASLSKSELQRQNSGNYVMNVTVELKGKPSPSPAAKPAAKASASPGTTK